MRISNNDIKDERDLRKIEDKVNEFFENQLKGVKVLSITDEITRRKKELKSEVNELATKLRENIVDYRPVIAHEIARKIKYIHQYIIKKKPNPEIQELLQKEEKVNEIYGNVYNYQTI